MIKKSIVFLFCVFAITASAQVSNESLKVVPEARKNEVYVNMTPILIHLMTESYDGVRRFSVTYKRSLTEKSALRLGLMADVREGYNHYNNLYLVEATSILNSGTDSITLVTRSSSEGSVMPHVKIGYERLFGKHKLKWFYGCDLSMGYSEEHSKRLYGTFYNDSTMQLGTLIDYGQGNYREKISKIKTLSAGLTPFFGAKYPISKRFLISAQVGVDATYQKITISNFGDVEESKKWSTSYYDFDTHVGFLNDVSLVYTF